MALLVREAMLMILSWTVQDIIKSNHRHGITTTAITGNTAKFQDLIEGADQALANVDSVLRSTGLCNVQKLFSDVRIRVGDNGGIMLEIIDTKLLPFDLKTTGKAAWRHFMQAMQTLPSRVYYPKVSSLCLLNWRATQSLSHMY